MNMNKFFFLLIIFSFFKGYSQSKDLTRKEAYEAFRKSELLKRNKISLLQFGSYYKQAKCIKANYFDNQDDAFRKMPIFQEKLPKDFKMTGSFPEFGIFDIIPKINEKGKANQCLDFNFR
ncbi:MAG: hypothetical protein DI529_07340 [Chryseobacterium sp.]|nr:MAG: hypothetical protein DI529_07340 [Chryseobacterium sp.]